MASASVPQARKIARVASWYAYLKDLPEVIPLVVLVGGVAAMAAYTFGRSYLGVNGGAVPSKDARADMEKQFSYGQEYLKPSVFWHVAQLRRTSDGTIDVGIAPFHNKVYKHDHTQVFHTGMKGVPAEGPSPTEY